MNQGQMHRNIDLTSMNNKSRVLVY